MARKSGFSWEAPPTRLAANLGKYDRQAQDAAGQIADVYATRMEAYAKAHAPWEDRTGNARQSLTGKTEKGPRLLRIWLYGDAPYLPFLELGTKFMRPYPVIWPTISAHTAPLLADIRRMLGA